MPNSQHLAATGGDVPKEDDVKIDKGLRTPASDNSVPIKDDQGKGDKGIGNLPLESEADSSGGSDPDKSDTVKLDKRL